MKIKPIVLYKKASNGSMQYWQISVNDFIIEWEWGKVGTDSPQTDHELVLEGKGGRTREEQIKSRMNSRMNKKVDAGYTTDISKAEKGATNSMGFLKPMLATPLNKVKDARLRDAIYQFKYDGHRCLIKIENGQPIAYSRNGKPIETITEILEHVQALSLPDGSTLDGELYLHGATLQAISSLVKRRQEATSGLVYVVYDTIQPVCYSDRLKWLQQHLRASERVQIANYFQIAPQDIQNTLQTAIKKGYEGLIARQLQFPYEDDKRSKGLIKIKHFEDDEFLIVDMEESVRGEGIFVCEAHNGKRFTATAFGTRSEKEYAARNPNEFIGKKVNIQFANLTPDGIPFHPVATMLRDKEAE